MKRHITTAAVLAAAMFVSACEESAKKPVNPDEKANLSLNMAGFTYSFQDGRHRYTHNREFSESTGVGVVITRGKVCVHSGEECADALVNYRVDGSSKIVQQGHYVATERDTDTITLEYWGKDDNGNEFNLQRVINVADKKANAR